jgi:hypothetical protein
MEDMGKLSTTERFLQIHGDGWDLECEVPPLDGPEFCVRA